MASPGTDSFCHAKKPSSQICRQVAEQYMDWRLKSVQHFSLWICSLWNCISSLFEGDMLVDVLCNVCVSMSISVLCPGGGSIWVPRQRRVVLAPILRQTTVLLAALRLRDLLGHRLVVMRPKTLALAGGDHADFVRPSVAVGTLQLDPACPGVRRDAAVVWGAASPPLATEDGVRHEVRRQALTRAHQLSDRLGTAARAVGDVTGRTQLPAAHLRGTWVEERR